MSGHTASMIFMCSRYPSKKMSVRMNAADNRPRPMKIRETMVSQAGTGMRLSLHSGGPHGRAAAIGAPATSCRTSSQNALTFALTGSVSIPSTL